MHPRIKTVRVSGPFRVHLTFADGTEGAVDLGPRLRGRAGVFALLQDPAYFAQVAVDPEAGTIVWPNGADIDPDVLYEAAHGVARAVGA